jgi:spore maturation protein CgeB
MRVVLFYHSLVSDWNHGNAHFLRGIASELLQRGHEVACFEPADAWSVQNLIAGHGHAPLEEFRRAYPHLSSTRYDPVTFQLDAALDGADLVIVHEWNDPALVARIGEHRSRGGGFRLLFHDTHHRTLSAPGDMARFDLSHYDGVLAFGAVLRQLYLERGWTQRAWTWHEAADTRLFRPLRERDAGAAGDLDGDVIWIGNWGDDERTAELAAFFLEPVRQLGMRAAVHGVRYPGHARARLRRSGIAYEGWLPNFKVPERFSRFRVTVHIPRAPYARALPGIPTIRPFEALACGIPLVSAPWDDCEQLFRTGSDYLVARDSAEMRRHLRNVTSDPALAGSLSASGRATILARHTCAHRVDELLHIHAQISNGVRQLDAAPAGAS